MKSKLLSNLGFKFISLGITILLALAVLGVPVGFAHAQGPIEACHFWGYLETYSGGDAPAGVTVKAFVGTEERGSMTTDVPGQYGSDPLDGFGYFLNVNGSDGESIRFEVDGEEAEVTGLWRFVEVDEEWQWQPQDLDYPLQQVTYVAGALYWADLVYEPGEAPPAENNPPVLDDIGDQDIEEGQPLQFPVEAYDPDALDSLTLSASPLPTGATFTDNGDGTGTFSWTPGSDDVGTHIVTFTVEDDGDPQKSDSETITITVYEPGEGPPANNPPVLSSGSVSPPSGDTSTEFLYTVTYTDVDGDSPNPINVTINGVSHSMSVQTDPVQDGDYTNGEIYEYSLTGSDLNTDADNKYQFDARDGTVDATGDTGEHTGPTVESEDTPGVNDEPVLYHIGSQSVVEGELLQFPVEAYDPDALDSLTLSASPLPTGATFTDNGDGTGTFSWTPGSDDVGTHIVTFTVEDDGDPQKSDSEDVTINVAAEEEEEVEEEEDGGTTPTGGGGGGGPTCGLIIVYPSTIEGKLVEDITGTSCDEMVSIFIPKGTIAKNRVGSRLRNIRIEDIAEPTFPLPSDYKLVGLVYNIEPRGATFEPPINLTIKYDEAKLPEGVTKENLLIATYDGSTRQWTNLESTWVSLGDTGDTAENAIRTGINHLTYFAILAHTAPAPPPATPTQPPAPSPTTPPETTEPTAPAAPTAPPETVPTAPAPAPSPEAAAFTVSNLSVSPNTVSPDENITITVDVANTGETEDVYVVTLKINGVVEVTQSVSIPGGQTRQVVFTTAKSEISSYNVEINGLMATFEVVQPTQLILIAGVIGGVIVLGLIIYFVRRIYLLKTGY